MLRFFDVSQTFLNPYALLPAAVGWMSLFQGLFIYQIDKENSFNRCVYYFCLCVFLWQTILGELFSSASVINAEILSSMLFSAIVITAAAIAHLSAGLTGFSRKKIIIICANYFLAFGVIFLIFQENFFGGINAGAYGMYPKAGINMCFVVAYISFCFLLSYVNFVQYHFRSKELEDRRYARFLMMLYFVLQLCFADVSTSYNYSIFPVSSMIFIFILLDLSFEQYRILQGQVTSGRDKFSSDLAGHSLKMSQVVLDLKDAQLKLLESGKMSALASLSAGILHQISQPITALHGVSSYLKSELNPKDQYYKAICMIDEQSKTLKGKLDDIMELIKHRKIRKEVINPNDIVARVISLLMDELRIKFVKWEARLEKDIPNIFADAIHLQQIFINIITNAIQAMDSLANINARYLVISTYYDEKDNTVNIAFQDTGPGVTKEDRDHIFEPFFPVFSLRAGIGLALCKNLIDEHSGKILLENVEDGGAKFIVKLPVSDEKDISSAIF